MDLKAVLASPFALPSTPKVLALLLSELQKNDPDLRMVSQIVSTDLGLTARLLQLSNSEFFELSQRVNSVSESLAILGLGHVRSMAHAAASNASIKAVPGINLQQFWDYSLNVAKVTRSLAGLVKQNPQAAFTAGLVHAMGELALRLCMPERMAQIDRDAGTLDLRRARVEQRALGYSYGQVSAGFARKWRYPQPIVDALEHQHAPFDNEVYEPLAGVIHLASWRARAREAGLSDNALAVTFPSEVGEVLGLDIDIVLQQDPIDWLAYTSPRGS